MNKNLLFSIALLLCSCGKLLTDKTNCTQVKEKCILFNGKGYCKTYYNNGNLGSIHFFNNGIKDGPFYKYYADGEIYSKGYYKNGVIHGIVIDFSTAGDTSFIFEFSNGEIISKLYFNENRRIGISNYLQKNDTIFNSDGSKKVIDW